MNFLNSPFAVELLNNIFSEQKDGFSYPCFPNRKNVFISGSGGILMLSAVVVKA